MSELIEIGGIQPLMKTLLEEGFLHGDCLTVTGETMASNLASVAPYPADQKIIRPLSDPIKKDSHLVVLKGNLAPEGGVAKITGHEGLTFKGRARCFHGEEAALAAILDGTVVSGDVVVVRYEGPKGGPGMREMLSPTSAINGRDYLRRWRSLQMADSPEARTVLSLVTSPPKHLKVDPLPF